MANDEVAEWYELKTKINSDSLCRNLIKDIDAFSSPYPALGDKSALEFGTSPPWKLLEAS